MPNQSEFIAHAAPMRAELLAHCYRMLGSVHEAEDLVQETYLRGWRNYDAFEERAALRTWLYRIATNACLRALQTRARRGLPAGLGEASVDPFTDPAAPLDGGRWLEPLPDTFTPELAVTAKQSVRLAVVAALQELTARQRAVLILRDVVQFSAAEVAELLETTPTAVNSALQRARAQLAEVAFDEDDVTEPDDSARIALVDRYCAAFEHADVAGLIELLHEDASLEMPPYAVWFTGREAVTTFLAARAFAPAGDRSMLRTSANGQPAVADYRRDASGAMTAHAIPVLDIASGDDGGAVITGLTVFLDPALFEAFGLPHQKRSSSDGGRPASF
jgi:RNA polymerase sigma-70 factor, ECF subfamily